MWFKKSLNEFSYDFIYQNNSLLKKLRGCFDKFTFQYIVKDLFQTS